MTTKNELTIETTGDVTLISQEGIQRRVAVQPSATAGLWTVRMPDHENPYEATISSGYTSQAEAQKAGEKFVLTGRFTAPKGEPAPVWLDDNGTWQLLKVDTLWPVVPTGLLLDFAGGRAMVVRTWEITPKTKAVLKAYESGAQPRVSVVERRVMPETIAFQLRVQSNLAKL
jgi:hypothetical protein